MNTQLIQIYKIEKWNKLLEVRDAGSSELNPICSNPGITRGTNTTLHYIYKSSSPGETTRAMESLECPLGMEISAGSPRSSSSSGSKSWGGF